MSAVNSKQCCLVIFLCASGHFAVIATSYAVGEILLVTPVNCGQMSCRYKLLTPNSYLIVLGFFLTFTWPTVSTV